jgi:hypothetical protein
VVKVRTRLEKKKAVILVASLALGTLAAGVTHASWGVAVQVTRNGASYASSPNYSYAPRGVVGRVVVTPTYARTNSFYASANFITELLATCSNGSYFFQASGTGTPANPAWGDKWYYCSTDGSVTVLGAAGAAGDPGTPPN